MVGYLEQTVVEPGSTATFGELSFRAGNQFFGSWLLKVPQTGGEWIPS